VKKLESNKNTDNNKIERKKEGEERKGEKRE
jgi:hypothetical protein